MRKLIVLLSLMMGASGFAAPSTSSTYGEESVFGQIGFDELRVSDLVIGIEPFEKLVKQDLLIDMRVTLDLQKVKASDHLDDTVDYVKLAELAKKEAKEGGYLFIDHLGIETLKKVFATYPEVDKASIRIQKPAALPNAKSGGLVKISLTRENYSQMANSKVLGDIGFEELLVHTVVGDLDEERENKQDLLVDLSATVDIKGLMETNDLKSTVSYVEMANLFDKVANDGEYYMFETLAVNFMNKLLEKYPRIEKAHVRIRKPGTLPNYPFKNNAITELTLARAEKGANQ